MYTKLFTPLLVFMTIITNAQQAKVNSGKLEHFTDFKSKYVDARNVDVWLPDGYSATEKYPVLYMHDGQALFDADINWNKQSWEVDETAERLIAEGQIKKCIIVAIWNNSMKRHSEYFPQKPYNKLTEEQKSFVSKTLLDGKYINESYQPNSDNYLRFLVTELKPFIDSHFATLTDKDNTFIAGSSMGGLISMYAICEYPKVFGAAACLSTHWPGIFTMENNPIPEAFYTYLKANLPNPKTNRIYFDYGDQTLDALYPPLQKKADDIMVAKGFTAENWLTKFFPGKDHSEAAWAERLEIPLMFLLQQ